MIVPAILPYVGLIRNPNIGECRHRESDQEEREKT